MKEIKRQLNQEEYLEYIKQWKEENKESIDSGKCKKVFLECLPRWSYGKNKGCIDWNKSLNYSIYFIYNDIKGWVESIYYNNNKIEIKCKNRTMVISIGNILQCKIGKILNKITSEFKIEIGTEIKDDSRNIIITHMKKIPDKNGRLRKYYKYHCNKCGFSCDKHYSIKEDVYKKELWVLEDNIKKQGCACCCSSTNIVVEGINDIPTTNPEMIRYFKNGYEEAKLYTCQSNKSIYPICPDCGRVKDKKMIINNIYKQHSINCSCSDKIPYGEKIMFSMLEQLKVEFKTQLTKVILKWCADYRYDFYFEYNNEKYIIEMNGRQHYEDAWSKLKKTQENDVLKKELALTNGIKEENYILIDCRKSELSWVKQNVLNSRLNELFDLNKIDWNKVEKFALKNRLKEACDLWNSGIHSTKEIAIIMKLCKGTVVTYLKKGYELKLTDYNSVISIKNNYKNNGRRIKTINSKSIISIDKGIIFESSVECSNISENIFGIKLTQGGITRIARGERQYYKGYQFKFISDLTEDQIKQIQENAKLN